jgi:hypothetical protein
MAVPAATELSEMELARAAPDFTEQLVNSRATVKMAERAMTEMREPELARAPRVFIIQIVPEFAHAISP